MVVGLSGGRLSDEKGCCLSSKTREKNVCRGRMIELSTEMARVAEVHWRLTVEFGGMKRIIDRKCLNHARVHANAQSFDRCEPVDGLRIQVHLCVDYRPPVSELVIFFRLWVQLWKIIFFLPSY